MDRFSTVMIIIAIIGAFTSTAFRVDAQKTLDHSDFAIWNQIRSVEVSPDGNWVVYKQSPGEGDPTCHVYHVPSGETLEFPRASKGHLTYDSRLFIARVSPPEDTLKAMRRRRVDKSDLPGDTLLIYDLQSQGRQLIPNVRDLEVPEKWAGAFAFSIDPGHGDADNGDEDDNKNSNARSYSKKNGFPYVVHNYLENTWDTLDFVTDLTFAEGGPTWLAYSTGDDSTLLAGVYVLTANDIKWQRIKRQKGDYCELTCDYSGNQVAFLGDTDTTQARIRAYQLFHWETGDDSARVLVKSRAGYMPDNWLLSKHMKPRFSRSGERIFYGVAPEPLLADTTLLDEEIVNVEVWHYLDDRLYTQQNVRADNERKRTYLATTDLRTGERVLIATEETPEFRMDPHFESRYVLLMNQQPYLRAMSWEGYALADVYLYDMVTDEVREVAEGIFGRPQLSPAFKYTVWYDRGDSLWHIQSNVTGANVLSVGIPHPLYNELHDAPVAAGSYGAAGWLEDDEAFLIYDRYDIWKIDPTGRQSPVRLTRGRENQIVHRYIRLDRDTLTIDPSSPILLHLFNENDKGSGYASLDINTLEVDVLEEGDYLFDSSPVKAKEANTLVYTKESFEVFPDLQLTTDWFQNSTRISNANPQQSEYNWGTAELFGWTAFDGKELHGVIVKPKNFDPGRKYPMIVNFYERSSDRLHKHRTPYPHRSTINYSFYASRGYVIFNPDVVYDIGKPGESAYNCVVSGVEAVLDLGYVDRDRVGVQGHSWGGYQVADLITRTDIFACAEAGAPLVNMINAYGGIRWQTGLSRMFQYEKTQSRLGTTLWEDPDRYIENSPLFNLDKVTTPVLIMHNDEDGHVPWHLGIEFFVAMRRLGKPAWLLNYNNEPHWPLKLQNRKDFNIRLQQFFDHYLMDAPMPKWMRDGVPATEKGILQGYEYVEEK